MCFSCGTRRALFHLTIFEDGSDLPGACWRRTSLVGIPAVKTFVCPRLRFPKDGYFDILN